MIKWNDKVKQQLDEYIKNPAVVMGPGEEPYEYRQTNSSYNRLKRRRVTGEVPFLLYSFVLENEISKTQLREFASGLFLNYVETCKIYV